MNELIASCLKKSRIQDYWSVDEQRYLVDFVDQQKFAELIIRECANIADAADENKCEWIGGNILVHFGVEE